MKEKISVRRESSTGEWGIPDQRGERVEARGLHSLQKRESESETVFGASRNTHENRNEEKREVSSRTIDKNILRDSKS